MWTTPATGRGRLDRSSTRCRLPSTSGFNALSAFVDERFDAVDVALNEERQYTEFAFDRLSGEMRNGFEEVNGRLNRIDRRVDGIDGRVDRIDGRIDRIDGRLDRIDGRLDGIDGRFDGIDSRFDRLARKLDQFIDTQSRANELVKRHLTWLEPRSSRE
jgi:hypothetical protein